MSIFRPLPTLTISKKKKYLQASFVKLAATSIFYVSLFLLTFSDFFNAQFDKEQRSTVKVGVASGRILAFVILVGSALLVDREFRRLLLGKTGILYGAVVIFYTWMGWRLFGNSIDWIRTDLYICLCLIVGLAIFRILANSYRPKIQLTSLVSVSNVFIYYSISLQAERMKSLANAGVTERIIDSNTWAYSSLLLPLTGIALGVLCRQGWFWTISLLGLVAMQLYSLGFISATRSVTLSVLTVVIFSAFGLSYSISNGALTTKLSLKQPKRLIYLLFLIGIFLVVAVFFINFEQLFVDRFQNSLIFERFFNPDRFAERSSQLRVDEAIDGIKHFQDILEIVFGKGLGSTFPSILGYEINAFHIGILTFLLKGGIIMFSCVVFTLYIKLPLLFTKSIVEPHRLDYLKRTALLTVLPGVFGWAVLLLLSGGYSPFDFLGVGFAFGAYSHIRKHGLGIFFE
ncbi:MAG: hypothetical protein GPJ21_17750 [Microcystis aeruginosa W13-11]|nr:hypothetical protein [Microcystis aeruginosa W13-11]